MGLNGKWQMANGKWQKDKKLEQLRRKTHQTIKKVTDDIRDSFHFNAAISAIMELVNEIYKSQVANRKSQATMGKPLKPETYSLPSGTIREAIETVVILLSPFAPHISEELWQLLGNKPSVFDKKWPKAKEEFLRQETFTLIVQINGKVRSKIEVPTDIKEDKLKEAILTDERLQKWIKGKEIKKFIIVPQKLVNLVL